MGETEKISNSIAKILTYVLVVLLVLGVAGGIFYFISLLFGEDDVVTDSFYLQYNEEYFYAGTEDEYSLDLVYGDNEFIVSEEDYTVKITSNPDSNFDITYKGSTYSFYSGSDTDDYTDIFDISYTDSGFIISLADDFTVMSAVESQFGGSIEATGLSKDDYFILTVTSGDSSIQVIIGGIQLSDLVLNYYSIAF